MKTPCPSVEDSRVFNTTEKKLKKGKAILFISQAL